MRTFGVQLLLHYEIHDSSTSALGGVLTKRVKREKRSKWAVKLSMCTVQQVITDGSTSFGHCTDMNSCTAAIKRKNLVDP